MRFLISPVGREILIDVHKNPYSTRDQVRNRLIDHSPVTVNEHIEVLVCNGFLSYLNSKLHITKSGERIIIQRSVMQV